MLEINNEHKQYYIIAAYIFAFLGGIIGVAIASLLLLSKDTRKHGVISIIISFVVLVCVSVLAS